MFRFLIKIILLSLFPLFLGISQPLSLKEVLVNVQKYHPALSAKDSEARSKAFKELASVGEFDAKLKSESKAYGAGYYEGRIIDTFITKPLEGTGVEIYSGYRVSDGGFPVYDGQNQTGEDGEFRMGINIPLLKNREYDSRRVFVALATQDSLQGQYGVLATKLKLQLATFQSYYNWVAAGQKVKVLEDLVKVAKLRQSQLNVQVGSGDKPRFDLTDNKRAVLKREADFIKIKQELFKNSQKLSFYYRNSTGEPKIPLDIQIPKTFKTRESISDVRRIFGFNLDQKNSDNIIVSEATIKTLLKKAKLLRPEFKVLQSQLEQFGKLEKLGENDALPQLDLDLQAAQDFGTAPKSIDQGELKLGFKFEIPLQYRKPEGKINSAQSEQNKIKEQLKLLESEIEVQLKEYLGALIAARNRLAIVEQELIAALELQQGEHVRFAQGDSNLIFVNLREQTAAEAALSRIDAVLDYQLIIAILKTLVGILDYK